MRSVVQALRQLLQPPEFRISRPAVPDEVLVAMRKIAEQAESAASHSGKDDGGELSFLADVATGIWRLRQRMLDPATKEPKEPFQREFRHVEAMWDALEAAGVAILDQTGQPFDPGLSLRVAEWVPAQGIQRSRIQETLKPTVYFKDKHIQQGEVIVETPAQNAAGSKQAGSAAESSQLPLTKE